MKHLLRGFVLITGLAVTLMAGSNVASGAGHERQWKDDGHAYDSARRAVDRGETLPIQELLRRLETQVPGEVVGIEFERGQGRWIYEFKIIDNGGRLLEVYVDARTGTVLSMGND
jgi:uncharacterized membrane protein YkoI